MVKTGLLGDVYAQKVKEACQFAMWYISLASVSPETITRRLQHVTDMLKRASN